MAQDLPIYNQERVMKAREALQILGCLIGIIFMFMGIPSMLTDIGDAKEWFLFSSCGWLMAIYGNKLDF